MKKLRIPIARLFNIKPSPKNKAMKNGLRYQKTSFVKELKYFRAFIFLAFLGTSCKKEWHNFPLKKQKCDYVQVFRWGNQPILGKHYIAGTHILTGIDFTIIDFGGENPTYKLDVTHSGYTSYFTEVSDRDANGENTATVDTIATLKYGKDMRPIEASAIWGQFSTVHFTFDYKSGKLSEIKSVEGILGAHSYAQIKYDATSNNISKIIFFKDGGRGLKNERMYEYDYNKKASNQYYVDEYKGWVYYFWDFVAYIDEFPELRPKNICLGYNENEENLPEKMVFSNHRFDSFDKLIEYKSDITFPGGHVGGEVWNTNWDCCKTGDYIKGNN